MTGFVLREVRSCAPAAQYDVSKERWHFGLIIGITIRQLEEQGGALIKELGDALSAREDMGNTLAPAAWKNPTGSFEYFHICYRQVWAARQPGYQMLGEKNSLTANCITGRRAQRPPKSNQIRSNKYLIV